LGGGDHVLSELRIAVEEEKLLRRCIRPSLAHLLHDPQRTRVPGDVEAQNLSPVMSDGEEAIQDAKGERRHRKEVHGGNRFTMVPQER